MPNAFGDARSLLVRLLDMSPDLCVCPFVLVIMPCVFGNINIDLVCGTPDVVGRWARILFWSSTRVAVLVSLVLLEGSCC